MTRFHCLIFFALCLGLGRVPALAWNAEGHMVVAQMAYNHLDPAVKATCDTLIAVPLTYASSSSSNFVTAAVWADDFKGSLGTGGWHYIDLPVPLDGTNTYGFMPDPSNVVYALNLCISNLESTIVSQSNKAVSLRYLLHFAGDIQQPMHCSSGVSAAEPGGDAGGNFFTLTGSWNNLHSLWDSGGGYLSDSISRQFAPGTQPTLNAKVVDVEATYPYTPNPGTIPDPMTWAQEGQGVAQNVAYVGITEFTTPSADYLNTAQATTKQRIAAGGHRLADLLNTLYSTNAMTLASLSKTNGQFSFSWSAIQGRTYYVQWKPQLTNAAWTDLTNVVAPGTTASFSESLTRTQRFYRVRQ